MPKPFYVVWSKQLVSLINIFWFYKPNHSKLDTYSTHLLALPHRDIGLNSEFKLHKPNSPCSFSFLEQTVPLLTLLEASLWSNSFCLIMSSSLMMSFLTYPNVKLMFFSLKVWKFHPFVHVCFSYWIISQNALMLLGESSGLFWVV